jgi:hypothetical protein
MKRLGILAWLLVAGCWWLAALVVEACPGCKEALFDPGQLQQKLSTAKGYALSIGLLLAVPFSLVAGGILFLVRASRHLPPR